MILDGVENGAVIIADRQTGGVGRMGRSFLSPGGVGIYLSYLLAPGCSGEKLSLLTSCAGLAVCGAITACTGLAPKIKWPNDIYIDDYKISGILIENKLSGACIDRSIAGIGLNVNQRVFLSDAPNPISLINIIGTETALEPLLESLAGRLADYVDNYNGDAAELKLRYMRRLYRGDGREYTFLRPDGTQFRAAITDVETDGTLHLSDGNVYAFKEVAYKI